MTLGISFAGNKVAGASNVAIISLPPNNIGLWIMLAALVTLVAYMWLWLNIPTLF